MSKVIIYSPPPTAQIKRCSVDFDLRRDPPKIYLVQYDKTLPIVEVALNKGGTAYQLPEDAEVNIRMGKRNKLAVYNPVLGCNEDRDRVYVEITTQMTTQDGVFDPILELKVGGGIAGTSPILFVVQRNPVQDDSVEDETERKTTEEYARQASESASAAAKSAEEASESAKAVQDNEESIRFIQDNIENIVKVGDNSENIEAVGQNISKVNSVANGMNDIQQVLEKMSSIEQAPKQAQNAENSAVQSKSWAVGGTGTREGEDTDNAKYWSGKVAEVSKSFAGVYDTPELLSETYPSAENGKIAVVLSTLTVWMWSGSSKKWVDTAPRGNLSEYGKLKVVDSYNASQGAAQSVAASPLALKKISECIYMVRTYARYNESNPRLLVVSVDLPSGVYAGINQFAVSVEVENEGDAAYDRFVQINSNTASVYFRKRDGSNFSSGDAVWFSAIVVVNR